MALKKELMTLPEVHKYFMDNLKGTPFTVTVEEHSLFTMFDSIEVVLQCKVLNKKMEWDSAGIRAGFIKKEAFRWKIEITMKTMMESYWKHIEESMGHKETIAALLSIMKKDETHKPVVERILLKAMMELNEEQLRKLRDA